MMNKNKKQGFRAQKGRFRVTLDHHPRIILAKTSHLGQFLAQSRITVILQSSYGFPRPPTRREQFELQH